MTIICVTKFIDKDGDEKMNKDKELNTDRKLLNIDRLAEYLNVNRNTIYAWISQKKIPYIKLGRLVRFRLNDILKWVQCNVFFPRNFD